MNLFTKGLVLGILVRLVGACLVAGCSERPGETGKLSAKAESTTDFNPASAAAQHRKPEEKILGKLLTALLDGSGRPVEVENGLAGKQLEKLRASIATRKSKDGLPVSVHFENSRLEGIFTADRGFQERRLPDEAKLLIVGIADHEDSGIWSISIDIDYDFTYNESKDSFFLGFGVLKH